MTGCHAHEDRAAAPPAVGQRHILGAAIEDLHTIAVPGGRDPTLGLHAHDGGGLDADDLTPSTTSGLDQADTRPGPDFQHPLGSGDVEQVDRPQLLASVAPSHQSPADLAEPTCRLAEAGQPQRANQHFTQPHRPSLIDRSAPTSGTSPSGGQGIQQRGWILGAVREQRAPS